MTANRLVIINPWQGIIGPNIGFLQLVEEGIRRNHEIHALCPGQDEIAARAQSAGATLHINRQLALTPRDTSPKSIAGHLSIAANQIRGTLQIIRQVRPDVVCVNSENVLFAPLVARFTNVPSAIYVRGARFSQLGTIAKIYFGFQKISKSIYIAVSRHVGDSLIQCGISQSLIEVIPNGVDTNRFHPVPADAMFKRELNIPATHKVIGTISHLTPRKGVHHLVEIMALLKDRLPEAICLIAGSRHDPAYAGNLENRISACGLSGRVRLIGEQKDVPRFLSCIDIMIHPSETESFGRVIVESMAMGKPVVGFDVGAVSELIQHEKTGFIARPFNYEHVAQYAEKLLQNPALCSWMGQQAIIRARQHDHLSQRRQGNRFAGQPRGEQSAFGISLPALGKPF